MSESKETIPTQGNPDFFTTAQLDIAKLWAQSMKEGWSMARFRRLVNFVLDDITEAMECADREAKVGKYHR